MPADTPASRIRRRIRRGVTAAGLVMVATAGSAQTIQVVPVPDQPLRIIPAVPEIGMGDWTPPGGGTQPTDPSQGGGGVSSGGGGTTGTSDALSLMQSQSWGQSATNAAQALGVNPNALAATCMIESNCNSNAKSGGSATGAFQMQGAAFQDGLNTALQANPSLLSQIVPGSAGINDPTTQSIAASGYLLQANQALQNAGIQSPSVVDARGYYEFGPNDGENIARSEPSTPMAAVVRSSSLAANNISPTMTVAEWQAGASAKMGGAANMGITS